MGQHSRHRSEPPQPLAEGELGREGGRGEGGRGRKGREEGEGGEREEGGEDGETEYSGLLLPPQTQSCCVEGSPLGITACVWAGSWGQQHFTRTSIMCMCWKECMSSSSRCGATPTSKTSRPSSRLGLSCKMESSRDASERAEDVCVYAQCTCFNER